MFSIPHMVVIFVIVLVVFGPQKLPELARSLGKLMAEFRKASSDFRGAFEEEMKDLERQAREVERKKAAEAAAKAADAAPVQAATLATVAGTETPERAAADEIAGGSVAAGEGAAGPVVGADGEVAFAAAATQAVFADVGRRFGNLIDARVTEGSKELVATPVTEAVARGGEDIEIASEAHSSAMTEATATYVSPDVAAGAAEAATGVAKNGDGIKADAPENGTKKNSVRDSFTSSVRSSFMSGESSENSIVLSGTPAAAGKPPKDAGGQMTFFEHLVELRKRIINSLIASGRGRGDWVVCRAAFY